MPDITGADDITGTDDEIIREQQAKELGHPLTHRGRKEKPPARRAEETSDKVRRRSDNDNR